MPSFCEPPNSAGRGLDPASTCTGFEEALPATARPVAAGRCPVCREEADTSAVPCPDGDSTTADGDHLAVACGGPAQRLRGGPQQSWATRKSDSEFN